MFTNFKNYMSAFTPEDLTGEKLSGILRGLGIAFIISFLIPHYDGRFEFLIEPEMSLQHGIFSAFTGVFSFYLPLLYGVLLIILSNYVQQKFFNIVFFCMALFPLLIFHRELHETRLSFFELTSINQAGTFWLAVLANCILLIGISHSNKVFKFITPRNFLLAGSLLFLINLFIPFYSYTRDFNIAYCVKKMLILTPFDLIGDGFLFTGIVLAVFIFIMMFLIVRAVFFPKTDELQNKSSNMSLFAAAWIFLIAGMLLAGNIDIFVRASRFTFHPWRENVRECIYFIKSALYILPLMSIIFLSASKLFTGIISKMKI